jgi:hypothetical protein
MNPPEKSWRREPWPWLLMMGPATVIVAGTVTTVLAVTGSDGLVADDYYRQGLAINRTLARDANARTLGIRGEMTFSEGRVRASLSANRALPDRIRLTLVHPTRSGEDRSAALARDATGAYSAPFAAPPQGRWNVVLEAGDWRLTTAAQWHEGVPVAVGERR